MKNAPDDDDEEPATRKDVNVWRPLAFKKASGRASEDVTPADIDETIHRHAEAQQQAALRSQRTDELIEAIHARGGAEKIRELLGQGVDLQAYDKSGDSLLHIAVSCQNTDAIILLLRAGMDPHVKNFDGITPLMAACGGYQTEACGVILADADPDLSFHTVDKIHALHIAAGDYDKTRLVEKLLERGAPPDIEDEKGRTPLWYAIANKLDCAEVICMAGGFRKKDLPALREAIAIPKLYGEVWDYELLLKHAAMLDPEELKKSFPKSGPVLPDEPEEAGIEIFDAVNHSNGESFQFRRFANNMAALQARDFDGQTPLMAALNGNTSIWAVGDLLWNSEAKVRDNAGRTPLHYAVLHVESPGGMIVGSLLQRGWVDPQDICGRTPLMVSVAKCADHLEMLMMKGASLDVKDRLGLTALDIAKIRKSKYAVEKLEQGQRRRKKSADAPAPR